MYTVRLIEQSSEEYIEQMTDLLQESFGFSYFGGALGTKELSRDLLKHHINAALVDPAGEVWVAEENSSGSASPKVVGVAVWFGPGGMYLATPEQRQAGWDQLYGKLDSQKQAWWNYFLGIYDSLSATLLGEGVKLGGFHLQVIGILKSHQRQGVAKSLFTAVEEQARARSVCTCLETGGNFAVPIYEALGYEVKGPVGLKSVNNPDATLPLYAFIKAFNSGT